MKKIFFMIVLLISFVSCKNEKKDNITESKKNSIQNKIKEETIESKLQISFNTIITSDKELILRYTESESLKYNPKNFVKVNIKGNETPQDVLFTLPSDIIPTKMRLNFDGKVKDSILVNHASFKMYGKTFEISKDKIWYFFNPNKFTEFNKESNTYIVKENKESGLSGFNFRPILIKRLEERVY